MIEMLGRVSLVRLDEIDEGALDFDFRKFIILFMFLIFLKLLT